MVWISAHPELVGDRLLSADEPVRFLPSRFSPQGEAIDPEGARTRRIACPRCHLEIPQLLLERPLTIMSVAGSPSSGKSFFLVSAIWKLREEFARSFFLAFTDTDPAMNRPLADNEARLFLAEDRKGLVHIDKTELEGAHYNSVQFDPGITSLLARPFLFTVRPSRDHVNGHGADRLTQLLALYDNAGEQFLPGAESARMPATQHLARARVLMFVFDPTQDVRFRDRLGGVSSDPQLAPGVRTCRQDQLIVEMAKRVRLHAGTSPGERVAKPLFLVVSKSDIWGPLLQDESGSPLDITSPPYESLRPGVGTVAIRRIDSVSERLRCLMRTITPEVVAAAEDSFERVIYVPVSAIGVSPEIDPASGLLKVQASRVAPRWVTVPFAYTLSRWASHLIDNDRGDPAAPLPSIDAAEDD